MIDALISHIRKNVSEQDNLFIEKDKPVSSESFLKKFDQSCHLLTEAGIQKGDIVLLDRLDDFESIIYFLSLLNNNNIVFLCNRSKYHQFIVPYFDYFISNGLIIKNDQSEASLKTQLRNIFNKGSAGIILQTTGTTGNPKFIIHDFNKLLLKYRAKKAKTIYASIYSLDHIAGLDALFYSLFSLSCFIITDRNIEAFLKTIEKRVVEQISITPSFVNLVYFSNLYKKYNLKSVKTLILGSEYLSEMTIHYIQLIFGNNPKVLQKYGSTEFGSLPSLTNPENPQLISIDKDRCDYKIIKGCLHICSPSIMLGHISGKKIIIKKSPWFNTNDLIKKEDGWYKIIGKKEITINVGGNKVIPSEVEDILHQMPGISYVKIYPVTNPIVGQVVGADVITNQDESRELLIQRIRKFCINKMEIYKIPTVITLIKTPVVNERMKS